MKKIYAVLLILAVIFGGCIDNEKSNPYDPDYDGPAGSIAGTALLEGGSAAAYEGPINNNIKLTHAGIKISIKELSHFPSTKTDKYGKYKMSNAPEGTWTLLFKKDGFNSEKLHNVTVSSGGTAHPKAVTLTEDVLGKIVFSSKFTATGWNELIRVDADGSNRKQLTFQDVNMEGGDMLGETDWVVFDFSSLEGFYPFENAGFFLYNTKNDNFFQLVLRDEAVELMWDYTSDVNWGPGVDPPVERQLAIGNGTANAAFGFTAGDSATHRSNGSLLFQVGEKEWNSYIGLIDVVIPDDGTAPFMPGRITSSKTGPYVLKNGDTLMFSIDGNPTVHTIVFNIGAVGEPDMAATGATLDISNPDPSQWTATASAADIAFYIILQWGNMYGTPVTVLWDVRGKLILRPNAAVFNVSDQYDPSGLYKQGNPDVSPEGIMAVATNYDIDDISRVNYLQTTDINVWGSTLYTPLNNTRRLLSNPYVIPDFDYDSAYDYVGDGYGGLTIYNGILPDATKLMAIWRTYRDECFPSMYIQNFSGVDWSEIVLYHNPANDNDPANLMYLAETVCDGSELVGTLPDGISVEPTNMIEQVGEFSEIWDPAWYPETFRWQDWDGTEYRESLIVFGGMSESLPGFEMEFYNIVTTADFANFPFGACDDEDWSGTCVAGTDRAFDPFDAASASPLWIDVQPQVLKYSLNAMTLDPDNDYAWDGVLYSFIDAEENVFVAQPSFSPEGDRIAYVAGSRSQVTGEVLRGDIYTVDTDAGFIKRLTFDEMYNRGPIWVW